jgi:hypothetical protein
MVARSFTVNAAPLTAQTITFGAIPVQTSGTSLTLTATASSGLTVSYTSIAGSVCTITGAATAALNAAGIQLLFREFNSTSGDFLAILIETDVEVRVRAGPSFGVARRPAPQQTSIGAG